MKNDYEFIKEKNNEEIPEIVNEKCQEAYSMIYKECEQRKRKKKISFKKGMALAACAAVVSVSVAALPVMAEHIPALQSAFEYISKKTYTKDPAEKNDVTKYAKPVNNEMIGNKADVTLQSVYCDGSNLAISLVLTPKSDDFKNTTVINGKLGITLDGKELIEIPEHRILGFSRADDGNYYCVLNFESLNITDESELKVHVYDLEGANGYVMNFDESISCYVPESTGKIDGEYDFEYNVTPDTSHNKTYEINETQGYITLESVTVTPFMTSISMSELNDENRSVRVLDQNGNQIESLGTGDLTYSSPLKTAKTLYIEVFRLDEDDFPTEYSFEVAIDEGFADVYDVEYEIDNSLVTYNPPMEELDAQAYDEFNNELSVVKDSLNECPPCPLGTTIKQPFGDESDDLLYMNTRILGSEVAEISDYEIDSDKLERVEEGSKLLLISYELENTYDKSIDYYFSGLEYINKTLEVNDYNDKYCMSDPDYISYKENGGKSLYKYSFAPNETKSITLGYILPEDIINDGFYAYAKENENGGGFSAESVINGKAKLYEIE